jgi:hypothetical protein
MKKNLSVIFLLLASSMVLHAQQVATGYVFNDLNRNGKKERREAGIPNVAVSNGSDVVLTNEKGFYSLEVNEGSSIFVIKPAGYMTPVDEDYIPMFVYHHKPEGSPESFTYKGVPPTGELPKSVNFPLYEQEEPTDFSVIVFGDPQPYSMQDLHYFTEKIVKNVKVKENTLFGISLGDIVGDKLDLHPPYKERVAP